MQQAARRADYLTGFQTPVLRMNSLAKLFGYTSFNWFNTTWVDEEGLESVSFKQILWQLIHEKWHTLAHHDIKRILALAAIGAGIFKTAIEIGAAAVVATGELPLMPDLFTNLPSVLLSMFLFAWHEEYCEHTADEYADKVTVTT